MNLKLETVVQFFRKIIQLNTVIILKGTNEYYPIIFSKSGRKMDLYPAMPRSPKQSNCSRKGNLELKVNYIFHMKFNSSGSSNSKL